MTSDKRTLLALICKSCHREFPDGTQFCTNCGTELIAEKDPLIGTVFADRYEIVERVGQGGMGVVYKAHHKHMDSFVAVKVLYKQFSRDQAALDRFEQEAKTLASLKHPNILSVHDYGVTPQQEPFLIMEYLEGKTLTEFLEEHGRMPLERALNIFVQACDGLAHAHHKGVIHRDLKPGNLVLIKEPGAVESVKIVDFGLAKTKPQGGKERQALTKAGEIFGSPLYMSPEQCQGQELDERSDIYSLGCVIYETLTSMPPLMGINSFETMTKHVNEQPLPLRGAAPDLAIPELIDFAVMKALSKAPEKRQRQVEELQKQLLDGAKSSGIYLETSSGYAPQPFETNQFEAVRDDAMERVIDADEREKDRQEKEELKKLVDDAVALAIKQDARTKQLRQVLMVFYCLLGLLVLSGFIFLTASGPPEDPAPNWQKQAWRWLMDSGDRAYASGEYKEAIDSYKSAATLGKQLGPIYDKETKAQLKLLDVYKITHDSSGAKALQKDLVADLVEREIKLYGEDSPDLSAVTEVDGGVVSNGTLDPKQLDPDSADLYSQLLLKQATVCFNAKKYRKAESWLKQAIEFEERAHGHSKGELTKIAADFSKKITPEEKAHMQEIDQLLERARQAESAK